jgi:hypothetical protein
MSQTMTTSENLVPSMSASYFPTGTAAVLRTMTGGLIGMLSPGQLIGEPESTVGDAPPFGMIVTGCG